MCFINVIESLILFMGGMESRVYRCSATFVKDLQCLSANSLNEEHLKRSMFSQVPIYVIQIMFYRFS